MAFANHSERFANMQNFSALKIIRSADNTTFQATKLAQFLVAQRNIEAGEEFLFTYCTSETFKKSCPFKDLNSKPVCYHCGKETLLGKKLSNCGKCKLAQYCNTDCQRNDWASHKGFCHK